MRSPRFYLLFVSLMLFAIQLPSISAQEQKPEPKPEPKKDEKPDPMSTATFAGLRFRAIGPAVTGGRVVDFAVDPSDRAKYFVAVASGGVWKTVNGGTTWSPVFDNYGSFSIGDLALDPKDPNVLWVGTGENNSHTRLYIGANKLFRSDDRGDSWRAISPTRAASSTATNCL